LPLSPTNDFTDHSKLDVLAIIWGTTLGVTLTQWFALTLAVRLVHDPSVAYSAAEMLWAQLVMAVLVAAAASTAVLTLTHDFDRFGARTTAAAFLGVLVGVESRAGGASWRRSLGFAVGALGIGVAIATVKWAIDH